jgi:hypothetical protein
MASGATANPALTGRPDGEHQEERSNQFNDVFAHGSSAPSA